jgi:hypothetical protein
LSQRTNCVVTVSQTKMGICLQFLWCDSSQQIYCTVDLVPVFGIKAMEPLQLAGIVNTAMMKQQLDGWLRYLKKYATSDLIITDLLGDNDRSNMIHSVLLKQLNFCSDNDYFVRPEARTLDAKI